MLALKTLRLLPASNYVFIKNGRGSALQSLQMISLSPGIDVARNHISSDFIISAPMTPYTIDSVRLFCSAGAGPQQQAEAKTSATVSPPPCPPPSSSPSPPPPLAKTASAVKAHPPSPFGDKSVGEQLLAQLPDKKQVEKYFFRTVAFIWDTSHWAYRIIKQNVDEHIVKNKSVQDHYKKFLDKMEKSKKD